MTVLPYIPNLLTVLRIVAVPVLIVLLTYEMFEAAVLLFGLAGISDGLDGYIAKRYHYETRLGAILDPVADKALIISCFVMLTILNYLPFWLMVTVAFRDVVIIGGYVVVVLLQGEVKMQPSRVSKLNTVFQICLVGWVLIQLAISVHIPYLVWTLVIAVTVTTIWSGVHYVWAWGFHRTTEAIDPDS